MKTCGFAMLNIVLIVIITVFLIYLFTKSSSSSSSHTDMSNKSYIRAVEPVVPTGLDDFDQLIYSS